MAVRYLLLGLVIGVGATVYLTGGAAVPAAVPAPAELTGPDTDKQPIQNQTTRGYIQRVTLFDDGTADVYLTADHGCYDTLEFGHTDSDTVYKRLTAPEFEGPATFDLRSVVESNGPYPSNEFVLELTTSGSSVCLSTGQTRAFVTVPAEWTG